MRKSTLRSLRQLRRHAERLNETFQDDHAQFLNRNHAQTYVRLPTEAIKPKPAENEESLKVTPTCSAYMAYGEMALSGEKQDKSLKKSIIENLTKLYAAPWNTAGLDANNAFTASICVRTAAYLLESGYVKPADLAAVKRTSADIENENSVRRKVNDGVITDEWRQLKDMTPRRICEHLLAKPEESLRIAPYPANAAFAYWLVDAADSLEAEISADCVRWAATEFLRQYSRSAARHPSVMDPVALAMAACTCRRLRRIAHAKPRIADRVRGTEFPTDDELKSAIRLFFRRQNRHGVWEKYIPFFHYPEAGPNYCWHFEVLEAVLREFPETLDAADIVQRVEKALAWLEANRLEAPVETGATARMFRGWNSGADVIAVQRGFPESWTTSVAHMCFAQLRMALEERIRAFVLRKYEHRIAAHPTRSREIWDNMLNSDLHGNLPHDGKTVKDLIEREMLRGVVEATGSGPQKVLPSKVSALLFGPPGTSKTTICEAVAQRLGWPLIELSPSDFLSGGLEGIYKQVNDVFDDLLDLYGAVVLFDEMDALVQSRDLPSDDGETVSPGGDAEVGGAAQPQLDVTQKFLTTSMLPRLQKLRGRKRIYFFMATNHIEQFDDAIRRAGRFDLLIHMGPPSVEEKLRYIRTVRDAVSESEADREKKREAEAAADRLDKILGNSPARPLLARFTYQETVQFLRALGEREGVQDFRKALLKAEEETISHLIREWAGEQIGLTDKKMPNFEKQQKLTRIQS